MAEDETNRETVDDKVQIRPLKIYLKDASYESPSHPSALDSDVDPALEVDIENSSTELAEDTYDVVLKITATANVGDNTAFLVEVHQAGVFLLMGFKPDKLHKILNVFCLRTLYPYACATIDDLVVKGGFPPLMLSPINFQARYETILEQPGSQDDQENGAL